jgi:hypothetical protein
VQLVLLLTLGGVLLVLMDQNLSMVELVEDKSQFLQILQVSALLILIVQ